MVATNSARLEACLWDFGNFDFHAIARNIASNKLYLGSSRTFIYKYNEL